MLTYYAPNRTLTAQKAMSLAWAASISAFLANFVVEGVAEAVGASEAQKVDVCNLMTNPGETDS